MSAYLAKQIAIKKIGGAERILTSNFYCEKILAYIVVIKKIGYYGKLYAVKS